MSTRTAHFVVTGETMTQAARDLMLSDEPGRAYRLLADCLIGSHTGEVARSVLAGTHDLAGDSDVGLELVDADETPELKAYRDQLRYIQAGRCRIGGRWLRPVARVVRYGPKDGAWASANARAGYSRAEDLRLFGRQRALYYCSEDETPELVEIDGERAYVIWEPCSELPHWVDPPTTFQEALDQALAAGRGLSERPSAAERELEDMEAREMARARETHERAIDRRQQDEEEAERQYKQLLSEIRDKVRAQAGDDTIVLELSDGRRLDVPRAPFTRWALRHKRKATLPEWKNVAPSGLKMAMDDPDHTDWVLGAGLELGEAYSEPVNAAAWDAAFEIQEQAREAREPYAGIRAAMRMLADTVHPAATVVDAGERTGIVGVDVAVFPDSEASRVDQLEGCVGVIVEHGGKLAHFAIVTKGRGITVMRKANACDLFKEGMRVNLNPVTGRIVVLDEDD